MQLDLAPVQRAAVLIGEHGQQQRIAQACFWWLPVDVEVVRIFTREPVAEHIPPPAIAAARDRHVIRHYVDHVTQSLALQRGNQARMRGLAAELVAQAGMIDHIVAVRAPGRRLQVRRGIQMTDAEGGQIIRNLGGGIEPETRAQLHAIRTTAPHTQGPSSRRALPRCAGQRGVMEKPWTVSSNPRSLRATVVISERQISASGCTCTGMLRATDSSGANIAFAPSPAG